MRLSAGEPCDIVRESRCFFVIHWVLYQQAPVVSKQWLKLACSRKETPFRNRCGFISKVPQLFLVARNGVTRMPATPANAGTGECTAFSIELTEFIDGLPHPKPGAF